MCGSVKKKWRILRPDSRQIQNYDLALATSLFAPTRARICVYIKLVCTLLHVDNAGRGSGICTGLSEKR